MLGEPIPDLMGPQLPYFLIFAFAHETPQAALSTVAKTALDKRKQASKTAQKAFRTALNKPGGQLPGGFTDNFRAPTHILYAPLMNLLTRSTMDDLRAMLLDGVLRVWVEVRDAEAAQVQDFLLAQGLPPVPPLETLTNGFTHNCTHAEFEALHQQFCEAYPDAAPGESWLLLALALRVLPTETLLPWDELAAGETGERGVWDDWLDTLDTLENLDDAPTFATYAATLAALSDGYRSKGFAALVENIRKLHDDAALCAFFEGEFNRDALNPYGVAPDDYETTARFLRDLTRTMREYYELVNQDGIPTDADKAREETLEASLSDRLPQLRETLQTDAPAFPAPPPLTDETFRGWADALHGLAPDDDTFAALPAFIEALQAAVADEQEKTAVLETVLTRLRGFTPPERSLLGIADADRWTVPDHPLTAKKRAALHDALALFERYIDLHTRKPTSFAERRQHKTDIDTLRPRVRAAAGIMRGIYGQIGQPSPPPTPETAPPAAAPVPADTPADTLPDTPPASPGPATPPAADPRLEPAEQIRRGVPEDVLELPAVARRLNPDHAADWHALLWALVEDGDLSAAYWLARSLDSAGLPVPVATDLLGAVQGARWLTLASDTYVQDLQQIAERHQPDVNQPVQSMLGVAAALPSLLIAPYSGLFDWLHTPASCAALHNVVEEVRQFAYNRVALQPAVVAVVSGQAQQENSIESVCADAQHWLQNARNERNRFKRAEVIWRKLSTPGGWLYDRLTIVAANDVSQRAQLREDMSLLQSERQIEAFIDERDTKKRASGPIVGAALEQLKRDVADAVQLATRWDKLVSYQQQASENGQDWQVENVRRLRDTLQEDLPAIHEMLNEMLRHTNPRMIRAAAYNLKQAVLLLQQTLAVPGTPPTIGWTPARNETYDLYDAFRYRLLFLPELRLNDQRYPVAADGTPDLNQIREPLRAACAEGRTLAQAAMLWTRRPHHDFRFIDNIRAMLTDPDEEAALADHATTEQAGLREALRRELDEREADIERAMLNGTIHDTQRAELVATLDGVKPDEVVNFGAVYSDLEGVKQKLKESRYDRLSSLQQRWEKDIAPRLPEAQRRLPPDQLAEVQARVATLLEMEDARLLDEYFSQLESYLQGHDLDLRWFNGEPDEADRVLEDYLAARDEIEATLHQIGTKRLREQILDSETTAGFAYGQLPRPRREEAANALKAWDYMKARGLQHLDQNPPKLHDLMSFLDFTFPANGERAVHLKNNGDNWLYYEVWATASELLNRPIPNFGSWARHLYHVVCVWDRPNADALSVMLHGLNLDRGNVIVLYFGRMKRARWEYILNISRDREMTMAIMDEILLTFLTQRGQVRSRLPDFLRCALPFTNAMPYTPYQAGDVPTEMFFGREDVARRLQSKDGGTILYGGRQLGKSALLRHVKRRFHSPENESYAWVEDIKLIGDHGQPTEALWERLLRGFRTNGLLPDAATFTTPEAAQGQIEAVMRANSRRRVLVMFDEADNFLERDATGPLPFAVVDRLRQIMVNTEYQFKVVFAGLHNVQRFQSSPNQPLAHFGQPINIGPLRAVPAQNLVREPLEALGYRIDEETVLRILSYTNYHPGLIQIFCYELLRMLRARSGNTWPPYPIRREDIEAVYLRPDVRDQIRERFGLTLRLDPRYQVITLALIVDQMERRDRFDGKYYAHQIEEQAGAWWQRGFADVTSDHFQGLLNEMRGLGILVRNQDGLYSLRNPNLVRLMGSTEDIETMLLRLSETPLPDETALETVHVPLDDAGDHYSPLNQAQARTINSVTHGVAVITATDANGLGDLPAAVHSITPHSTGQNRVRFQVVPTDSLKTADMVARYVRDEQAAAQPADYTVLYIEPTRVLERYMGDLLESLIALDLERTPTSAFRVIVVLPPRALREWLRGRTTAHREAVRACLGAFVVCHPWTDTAIQQRLHHLELPDDAERAADILARTGGWHALLADYLHTWRRTPSPATPLDWAYPPPDATPAALRAGFGLDDDPALAAILELVQLGAHRVEITPGNLAEFAAYPDADAETCAALVDYLLLTNVVREDAEGRLHLNQQVAEVLV